MLRESNTVVLFALALFAFAVSGQTPDKDEQTIKVDTLLVNLPVIASDRQGRYVAGLKSDNFTIMQDGVKQEIGFFADQKEPMSVVILIDTSGSTRDFLGNIKSAASEFIKVLRPEDKGMVVSFETGMTVLQDFTSNQKKLAKAIDRVEISRGGSNMQDAMYTIVTKSFDRVEGRKAVIVLTDGIVSGHTSNETLLELLGESDILVYSILFGPADFGIVPDRFPETRKMPDGSVITREQYLKLLREQMIRRVQFMYTLSSATGGRVLLAKSKDFTESFQNIADELKNQYLVGFYPLNTDMTITHKYSISVNSNDIAIRTKKDIRIKATHAAK